MEKSNTEFEVKEGRTTIVVPHKGKRVTFVAPYFGTGTYNQVGKQIDDAKLLRPTFAETVSLVYSAIQNKDKKYAQQVLDILNTNWLWGFNNIIYKPKEGAFISDRNRKDVHVPFGFKTGEYSIANLVKNPFVLALTEGEEGAEKLGKIAKSQKITPCVWSFDKVDSKTNRVASLDSDEDGGLNVNGDYLVGDGNGVAFGVLE